MTPLTNQIIAPNLLSDIVPSEAITPFDRGGATDFMEHWKNLSLENIESEEWKSIDTYPFHLVSSFGRVKSLKRDVFLGERKLKYCTVTGVRHIKEKILTQRLNRYGYPYVTLASQGRKTKSYCAHSLVARAFIPNPENKNTVNHKKGIKTDNRVTELEWHTEEENRNHAVLNGFSKGINLGSTNNGAKLNEQQVLEIKRLLIDYKPKQYKRSTYPSEVAKMYNISTNTIYSIISKTTWGHLNIE